MSELEVAKMVGIRISENLRTRLGIAVALKRVTLQRFANELLREALNTYGVLNKECDSIYTSIDKHRVKRNGKKEKVMFFFRIDCDLYSPLVEVLMMQQISEQQFLTELLTDGIEKIEDEYGLQRFIFSQNHTAK